MSKKQKNSLEESSIKRKYLVTPRDGDEYLADLTDEEATNLRGKGASLKNPATGIKDNGLTEGEEYQQSDILNAAKSLNTAVMEALRDHGDAVAYTSPKFQKPNIINIYVSYEQNSDNPGKPSEDKFSFVLDNGKVKLVDDKTTEDICPLEQQSGTLDINKDLVKNALTKFIENHDTVYNEGCCGECDDSAANTEGNDHDLLLGFKKKKNLWENEENIQRFCEAVKNYKAGKSKDSIKNLFRAARGFKEGNTIQEKVAGAIKWYKDNQDGNSDLAYKKPGEHDVNDYLSKIQDPSKLDKARYKIFGPDRGLKETKEPVFDSEGFDVYRNFLTPVTALLEKFKEHVNRTQDTWVGSYYRSIYDAVENFSNFVQKYDKPEPLDETGLRSRSECLSVDMPLFIRLLEYAKEDAGTDMDLHKVAENLQTVCNNGGCADMSDYDTIIGGSQIEGDSENQEPLSETKIVENYSELFKKFLKEFTLEELAKTWEKIYPEHYNELKDTILYPYANIIEHILVAKGVISAADGTIISRPWEEDNQDEAGSENLEEANMPSEDEIAEALKAFKEVESQGYVDPWFRGHAPGHVDLTCLASSGKYKFIWDVPAEMDKDEQVTSTGKIYELDITFPNGKTINLDENSLEKRGFYNDSSLDEISSDTIDRAADKAEKLGRFGQAGSFRDEAPIRRAKELEKSQDIRDYVRARRDSISVVDSDRETYYIYTIHKDGTVERAERNMQYGGGVPKTEFPLDWDWKLSGSRAKPLAKVVARWFEKYGDKSAEHYDEMCDWHNWVQL